MRKIIIIAVSSIFILSACNNQSVITEANVEETTKETIIETTVEETTTIQETTKEKDKVQEIADRINGIKKGEFTDELLQEYGINGKEEFFSKLAEKGLYCFFDDSATEKYDWDNYIIKVVNKEELTELLQKYIERTDGGIFYNETEQILDELKKPYEQKKEQEAKAKTQAQVQSNIIRLSAPKTVDQIGGNKLGDNDGTYKGEFRQEPRRYGQEVFPGSMLVAVNGFFGDENTAQQYYECRNGFVILNNAGYKFRDNMLKTETERAKVSIFDKVEFEVFKLNNPNTKIIEQDYNRDYDEYGTFSTGGQPLWQENYGQPVITILGRCMHQEGTIIDGQLTTKQWTTQGYRNAGCSDNGGASAPWCRDSAGNRNEQYDLEVVWRGGIEGGHINTIEERNAVIRRYITK